MRASPKPLDMALIRRLAADHDVLITIEEGSVGRLRLVRPAGPDERRRVRRRAAQVPLDGPFPTSSSSTTSPKSSTSRPVLDAKGIVAKVLETMGQGANDPRPRAA